MRHILLPLDKAFSFLYAALMPLMLHATDLMTAREINQCSSSPLSKNISLKLFN